jgi:hypothetical protein
MEGIQLCTKSLRRSAERGIGDMRIPFFRRWIGMAEEAATIAPSAVPRMFLNTQETPEMHS